MVSIRVDLNTERFTSRRAQVHTQAGPSLPTFYQEHVLTDSSYKLPSRQGLQHFEKSLSDRSKRWFPLTINRQTWECRSPPGASSCRRRWIFQAPHTPAVSARPPSWKTWRTQSAGVGWPTKYGGHEEHIAMFCAMFCFFVGVCVCCVM